MCLHMQNNEKSLQRWLDHELEVVVNVHEVRFEYEKQNQVYVSSLSLSLPPSLGFDCHVN